MDSSHSGMERYGIPSDPLQLGRRSVTLETHKPFVSHLKWTALGDSNQRGSKHALPGLSQPICSLHSEVRAGQWLCPLSPLETERWPLPSAHRALKVHLSSLHYSHCLSSCWGQGGEVSQLTFPPLVTAAYLGSKSATGLRSWGLEMKCCSCARISWKWGRLIRSCDQQLFMSS